MRLGIATKVFIALAGVTLIFSFVLMFGVYRTQMLHGQLRALNHRVVPLSLQLSDIENDLKSFHIVLNESDPSVLRRTLQLTRLLDTMPDDLDERFDRAAATADLSDLDDVPASEIDAFDDIHTSIGQLQQPGAEFAESTREFSQLVLRDDTLNEVDEQQLHTLQESLREQARRLDTELATIRSELQTATDEALVRADETERTSVYGLALLSVFALLTALVLMYAVLHTLRPLTDLTQAAKRIGEGDYSPISAPRRRLTGDDEITLLAREFNAMAQKLAERDARLRRQHDALIQSERLATIGRMTSLITHEIRNPLSSINLNAEMLMEGLYEHGIDPDDPDVMPLLETIIEEVDHLGDITEEYLVYARLPSPELDDEQLDDIVRNLIDFHGWQWRGDGYDIDLQVRQHPIDIRGDANQLRQALLNVLKNAIDASEPGDTIEVELATDGDNAEVVVRDEGVGMDEQTRQRLFEPFFTTKSSGTGLGMPMTREIIEQHDGEIDVNSTPGDGTTFTITLPLGQSLSEPAQRPDDPEPSPAS